MKVGDKLVEKHSDLVCTVESVHVTHMMVRFEESGLPWLVHQDRYKYFTKINESVLDAQSIS